ncbi:site-2 protease family protein [Desulfuribacillus alkaliarsenatis]|uniref:Peptidase M50 domain-containing protein n=1 Tax=Desulfuribacillus alkaliarsenatis TaxID=766136 RepID=A0A1E5G5C0_9FIRM|nr:site-2 protease family protein [Desulfuribacillus alkaliarsenatis]OEF98353.1 hypothetical protein BHF68_01345 [Desulfuribacillus alkaliarsenatis]
MKLRIHWLFLVFLIYIGYSGQVFEALLFFLIVIIHELGHVFVARSFGWRVTEIEFLPFGGVAKVDWNFQGWPRQEKLVAIAGPMNNIIMIMIALVLFQFGVIERDLAMFFIKANMLLAGFNLLPALPLDGGRIYRATVCQEHGWIEGTRMAYRLSYIIGAILVLVGLIMLALGYLNVTFLILGAFLLLATFMDQRQMKYQQMYALLHKNYKQASAKTTSEQIKHISTNKDEKISDIIKVFSPGITTIVWVMDNNKVIGTLTDNEILHKVFDEQVPLHMSMEDMLNL